MGGRQGGEAWGRARSGLCASAPGLGDGDPAGAIAVLGGVRRGAERGARLGWEERAPDDEGGTAA